MLGLPLFFVGCLLISSGFITAGDISASSSLGTDYLSRVTYHLSMPVIVLLLGGLLMAVSPWGLYTIWKAGEYERASKKIAPRPWTYKTKDNPDDHTGGVYLGDTTVMYSGGKKYTTYNDGSYDVEDFQIPEDQNDWKNL